MSSSMTFFLFALCFTAATASPLAARDYPPITPPVSVTPSVPVPATTSCPPTVTVPPVPPLVPPCTKNCPPPSPPVVDPPCTKNCPTVPPCTKDCPPKDPVVPQGSCHPNFAGAALTLSTASGALSWSAKPVVGNPLSASSSPSKFFFQQTGFPVVSYTVKTVEDVNFALEVKGGAPLIGNTDPSGSNQCQKCFYTHSFFMDIGLIVVAGRGNRHSHIRLLFRRLLAYDTVSSVSVETVNHRADSIIWCASLPDSPMLAENSGSGWEASGDALVFTDLDLSEEDEDLLPRH
ncbi:hypothetical protein EV421DRAFT_1738543 [Armillaria borealis]|uniref:Uncharacterized protein n=1 Tax=Armillaria borealis TaxID=47425 RepID=A0AA39JBB6_9AGAR|nr:hypothetical protein EV421DRAFT_1738543 [Armillaria borealis]